MELIKLNEAFNIVDTTIDGWETQGQVIKDLDGSIKINFSVTKDDKHVGSCSYQIVTGGNLVNFNVSSSVDAEYSFITYSSSVVENILKELQK